MGDASPPGWDELVRVAGGARDDAENGHPLSAGRTEMDEASQAMCFLAGANSIFVGDELLTTPNPARRATLRSWRSWGSRPDRSGEAGRRRRPRRHPSTSSFSTSSLPWSRARSAVGSPSPSRRRSVGPRRSRRERLPGAGQGSAARRCGARGARGGGRRRPGCAAPRRRRRGGVPPWSAGRLLARLRARALPAERDPRQPGRHRSPRGPRRRRPLRRAESRVADRRDAAGARRGARVPALRSRRRRKAAPRRARLPSPLRGRRVDLQHGGRRGAPRGAGGAVRAPRRLDDRRRGPRRRARGAAGCGPLGRGRRGRRARARRAPHRDRRQGARSWWSAPRRIAGRGGGGREPGRAFIFTTAPRRPSPPRSPRGSRWRPGTRRCVRGRSRSRSAPRARSVYLAPPARSSRWCSGTTSEPSRLPGASPPPASTSAPSGLHGAGGDRQTAPDLQRSARGGRRRPRARAPRSPPRGGASPRRGGRRCSGDRRLRHGHRRREDGRGGGPRAGAGRALLEAPSRQGTTATRPRCTGSPLWTRPTGSSPRRLFALPASPHEAAAAEGGGCRSRSSRRASRPTPPLTRGRSSWSSRVGSRCRSPTT